MEWARAGYHLGLLELGLRLVESFESFYKKNLGIAVLDGDTPRYENSVSLWPDQLDQFGVPGVRVVYQVDSNSKKLLAHGFAKASTVLVEAGAIKVFKHTPVRNVGCHMMGTLKMGESATESVVSPTGETHDIAGLYVFDSSVFVTGSCVNPANTVQAFALLLADRVASE